MSLIDALSMETVVILSAAGAAFVTVLAVWSALLAKNPLSQRARTLTSHRAALRAGLLAPKKNSHRRVQAVSFMSRVAERLNLLKSQQADKVAIYLARAGWRSKEALAVYLFMKVALPLVFGVLVLVAVYGLELLNLPPMMRLLAAMVTVVAGAYAPDIFVRNAVKKRAAALAKGLPDALDLLVICAEAGLGLDAALGRVAGEMERSSPEISDEFGVTAVELGFLPERRDALDNLSRRTNQAAIRGVVNTLAQTEKYGTPLAQSLRVLAAEFRGERMMKAEEKAAKLPAILTIPLVVFVLPTLFVVLLGPAILRALDGLGSL